MILFILKKIRNVDVIIIILIVEILKKLNLIFFKINNLSKSVTSDLANTNLGDAVLAIVKLLILKINFFFSLQQN